MNDPTVYIVIEGSAIAFGESGEVLETVEWNAVNQPIWDHAGICDHRGSGGALGFSLLVEALNAAEENARIIGYAVQRVGDEKV